MPIIADKNQCYPPITPHVYFVPLDDELHSADFSAGLALGWLSEDEVAKVARYKSPSARNNALQVRLALRAVLSRHSKVKPAQWQFIYGAKGKPALSHDLSALTGLDFNLSHSGQWLMIGVIETTTSQQNVNLEPELSVELTQSTQSVHLPSLCFGVDIERERSSTDIVPILNHYFTQAETEALLQLPIELQRQRFFDLWAVKESYIKARGLGLALSLKSFAVDFSELNEGYVQLKGKVEQSVVLHQGVRLNFTDAEDIANTMIWQTQMGRLDQHYRFAVTLGVNKQDIGLELTRADDCGDSALTVYQFSLAQLLVDANA
ncbi:4'-phosphopantetheinyl transferase family protein [Shewanella ulleungensis]|uniref:4'-phosphopantetheinyl transferase n=1 Tax=Shewanella ulleungensis TaxID=2282699 RepID=A0ABQ2QZ00_9GAMM|nr:4'-phosphopantetheinyl transferase superfamily protein [Shewanella ulleungensis]MCL1151494.1 4'-phosphopantetheinyl transferase superfamily protein [Shewanella ulleungensis]GGQ01082.1 4'-phosphopantetheinyl transferase [Shewanella ulleungensis]